MVTSFTWKYLSNVVITVQFAERHYVGTESSRVMMVRVVITSGSFSSAVIATVQPSQLSPVSANGNSLYHNYEYKC